MEKNERQLTDAKIMKMAQGLTIQGVVDYCKFRGFSKDLQYIQENMEKWKIEKIK